MTVIDTDILIDFARGEALAATTLQTLQQDFQLTISAVTEMKLIVGCENKAELRTLETFLERFHVVKLNEAISDKAAELLKRYKLSHNLLIPDALIAATALTLNEPLISKNQRDYRFIANLNLLPYP